ncbi:hypothetical protein AJ78_05354 [Emergomyces pasteurianus Ep9510]|uniref:HNH nuclease domain-containing protein n=1 Tax=Emergomyces pasteurianus Ep9510 TaxID=1447872 RepID=A0A1J9QGG5_9EURO|nr:hypothetical protein AJ78_05354 [Emergomyces pasteurianus Ep9510]
MDMLFDDTDAEKAERTSLLHELDILVQGQTFSRELWACLRLADLDRLRFILTKVRESAVYLIGLEGSVRGSKLLPYWKHQTRDASRTSSIAASPSQASSPAQPDVTDTSPRPRKRQRLGQQVRDRMQRDLCRQRDGSKCVITNSGEPVEVAHIFPFAMRDLQTPEARAQVFSPWQTLKLFWTEEKVNRWLNAIQATTETLKNLFCLAPHTHAYQSKAYFTLKYIESNEDHTSLTVMFMWLPHFDHSHSLRVCTEPSAVPVIKFRKDAAGGVVGLLNTLTEAPVATGDQIILQTTDPVNLPLPDVNLLDLHWVLQRVAAMAGGGESQDEIYETDDEDNGDCGALIDEDSDVSSLSISPKYSTTSQLVAPDLGSREFHTILQA